MLHKIQMYHDMQVLESKISIFRWLIYFVHIKEKESSDIWWLLTSSLC